MLLIFLWVVVQLLSRVQHFCDPTDCSLSGSSVHGISNARILECVSISFSRASSQTRDQTPVSCIGRQILYSWSTGEAPFLQDRNLNIIMPIWKVYKLKFRKVIQWQTWGLTLSFGASSPFLATVLCLCSQVEIELKALTYTSVVFFPWSHSCGFCISSFEQNLWNVNCLFTSRDVNTENNNCSCWFSL